MPRQVGESELGLQAALPSRRRTLAAIILRRLAGMCSTKSCLEGAFGGNKFPEALPHCMG
eukprot:scaffold126386_cov15-Tisochrysis_lutea.AAC.1